MVTAAMYINFIRCNEWISRRTKDALNQAFLRLVDIVLVVEISVKYNTGWTYSKTIQKIYFINNVCHKVEPVTVIALRLGPTSAQAKLSVTLSDLPSSSYFWKKKKTEWWF